MDAGRDVGAEQAGHEQLGYLSACIAISIMREEEEGIVAARHIAQSLGVLAESPFELVTLSCLRVGLRHHLGWQVVTEGLVLECRGGHRFEQAAIIVYEAGLFALEILEEDHVRCARLAGGFHRFLDIRAGRGCPIRIGFVHAPDPQGPHLNIRAKHDDLDIGRVGKRETVFRYAGCLCRDSANHCTSERPRDRGLHCPKRHPIPQMLPRSRVTEH